MTTIINPLPFILQNGTTADATQVMADFNQIVANTNLNAAGNGANSDITSLLGLTTPLSPTLGGTRDWYATAMTSAANSITVTASNPTANPPVSAYFLELIAPISNTAACALTAFGFATTDIKRFVPGVGKTPLVGGEILTGNLYRFINDGTNWIILNPSSDGIVGEMRAYGGASPPSGWVLCFGQAVSRTTFAALFALISTVWGVGDGATTFNLPDLRGRSVFGKDDMGGGAANRITNAISAIVGTTLGAVGGSQSLTAHVHGVTDTGHGHPGSTPAVLVDSGSTASAGPPGGVLATGPTGIVISPAVTGLTVNSAGAGASQNMTPTAIVNLIIKQ
jgi:microcystin-dependent protein